MAGCGAAAPAAAPVSALAAGAVPGSAMPLPGLAQMATAPVAPAYQGAPQAGGLVPVSNPFAVQAPQPANGLPLPGSTPVIPAPRPMQTPGIIPPGVFAAAAPALVQSFAPPVRAAYGAPAPNTQAAAMAAFAGPITVTGPTTPLPAPGSLTISSDASASAVATASNLTLGGPAAAPMAAAAAAAAPAPAPAAAGPVAPVAPIIGGTGSPEDTALVRATLDALQRSPIGAAIVQQMNAVGSKIEVMSDAQFAQAGHGGSNAFYDTGNDTMYLRRSHLATNPGFSAIELAHEATHMLDDKAGIIRGFEAQAQAGAAALGGNTPAAIEAARQSRFELTMIMETRAFVITGQVARELGLQVNPSSITGVAARGPNDQQTYSNVWTKLLTSTYNDEGRQAAVRSL
jgi:hypothetical protein